MLFSTSLAATAVLFLLSAIAPSQAHDCRRIAFGYTADFQSASNCKSTCEHRATSNHALQVVHRDVCEADDGLSDVIVHWEDKGLCRTCTGIFLNCRCAYTTIMYRAHKSDQNGNTCNPFRLALRIAHDFAPYQWVTTNDDVHCAHQNSENLLEMSDTSATTNGTVPAEADAYMEANPTPVQEDIRE